MDMGATFLPRKKEKTKFAFLEDGWGQLTVSEPASQHSHGGKGCSHLSNAGHHLPAESLWQRPLKGAVILRWRVRCMAGLVCGSQLLEELRHLRLQDDQI
jgi:hypothetical protein